MTSRLVTTDRMSNAGYHANGKPTWWARANGAFLDIPRIRGDAYLDVEVDVPAGTEVSCGAGKGSYKTVRETVVTV